MSRAPLGGHAHHEYRRRLVALAELVDDIFDPKHFAHIAPGEDLAQARAEGRAVVGLCGFTRVPLPPEELPGVCPICEAVRAERRRLRDVWGWEG